MGTAKALEDAFEVGWGAGTGEGAYDHEDGPNG